MRNLSSTIFLLIIASGISSLMCAPSKQNVKTKFQVSGSIMQTVSYCGGAQPTKAMLDSFNSPRGIPFGRLFVKEGLTNGETSKIIDTIVAKADGTFSIDLPPGNYCLVEAWKSKSYQLPSNNKDQTIDSTCYKNLYKACDFQLSVTNKNIENIKILFHRKCVFNQPCVSYHGPLPPAAPAH